jgi:hypothetical protein
MLNSTGEVLLTDGGLAVFRLKNCRGDGLAADVGGAAAFKPGSKFFRYLRKEILTVRSDLLRANCIYAVFRVTVAGTNALRQRAAHRSEIKSLGLRPVATPDNQALRQPPERPATAPHPVANE